ncbi:MAG: LptF/LptG family permease [Acidobacteriota bacterium]
MLKAFDKYVLKEIASPFAIGLLIYTFTLLINMIFILSQTLISKGATTFTIVKILVYLLPDILSFTIPMATLMGVLAGMSRMSTDSEIVALRTMGVNNFRIFRPIIIFSLITWFISSILIMYLAPEGNYQYRKLNTKIMLSKAMSSMKPRTFNYELYPFVLFFNDIDKKTNEWKDVFLYSRKDPRTDNVILAKRGSFIQLEGERKSYFSLKNATLHSFEKMNPGKKYFTTFHKKTSEEIMETLTVKRTRSSQQLIFPELIKKMKERPDDIGLKREFHRKFSLPFACLALGFLALSLGISTKKGGKVSGFIISLGIIFIYYTAITTFQNIVMKGIVSPFFGMWAPNFFLLLSGLIFYYYSSREKSINWDKIFSIFHREKFKGEKKKGNIVFSISIKKPQLRLFKIIDVYILKKMVAMLLFIFTSLLMVFYIVRIVELIDTMIENNIPFAYVLKYVYYNTPEMISFVLPVSILTTVLLTFSIMSKNNEITAVRVSGISLYRIAVPAIVVGIFFSFLYFYIQETITPGANRNAVRVLNKIYKRKSAPDPELYKTWISGKDNTFYFYSLDTKNLGKKYKNFNILKLNKDFSIKERISARTAVWKNKKDIVLRRGFTRDFTNNSPVRFSTFNKKIFNIEEGKSYFSKKVSYGRHMNISQLKEYIKYLKKNGSETTRYEAKLFYHYAFPFSSLIMVLIAIPFSFRMGKKGTLFGIGIAVAISMVFWAIFSIFSAMGSASVLSPFISAFAPILLFASISIYLFVNIKT